MKSKDQRDTYQSKDVKVKHGRYIVILTGIVTFLSILFGILRYQQTIYDQQIVDTKQLRLLETPVKGSSKIIIGSAKCQCQSYLSQNDCEQNQCIWNAGCSQQKCSCLTDQRKCNNSNGCAWTNFQTCIPIDCTQLTSLSSGGCFRQGCSQSTVKNLDGSYNCTAWMNTSFNLQQECASLRYEDCSDYCIWSINNTCIEKTCKMLKFDFECTYVYQGIGTSNPVQIACMIDTKSHSCMDATTEAINEDRCNSVSRNTYTWSTASAQCTICLVQTINTITSQCMANILMTAIAIHIIIL